MELNLYNIIKAKRKLKGIFSVLNGKYSFKNLDVIIFTIEGV